jgi:hypothetical protein
MADQKQGHDLSSTIWAIWMGGAVGSFAVMVYGAATDAPLDWVFIVPLALAFVATIVVMFLHYRLEGPTSGAAREADFEKVKRGSGDQLQLLLSLMDEDEVAAFKARLADRVLGDADRLSDGELPYDIDTLESLLSDEQARH